METDGPAESLLVDVEERAKPWAEERHHRTVGVGEAHRPVALGALPCVEGGAGSEERRLAQLADALDAESVAFCDLAKASLVLRVSRRCGPVRRGDGVNGTSRTQTDTDDLATPRSRAMSARVRFCERSTRARA
jgi:hypothetical protein